MKKNIQQFLFGSSFTASNPSQFIWLLFRLHIGLSMAIEAGFGKVKDITPPEWFVKQVGDIGFTFISPTFWAFLSSWGEFLGGLFIAIGFLTRFSAIQLAFQFFVISFIWYDKPQPITGMYIQQIYLWCYVAVAGFGGGKFSVDYLIMNKKATKTNYANMPKMATLLILFCISVFTSQAQMGPLNGSGVVVNKTFDFNNFDKISFDDLDGKIDIEVGKPFAININIDDNLDKLLAVDQKNGELQVKLLNNRNNKLYLENTNIKITISLPQLLQMSHSGNSRLKVSNISGNNFKFKSAGNGSTNLSGTINKFELKKSGNGNVNAIHLVANSANITKTGNGDIELHSNNNFNFSSTGNGNIINYGNGLGIVDGVKSGNGRIVYKSKSPYKMNAKFSLKDIGEYGGFWQGKLTYKNYDNNEENSINATIRLNINEAANTISFEYDFPKEPGNGSKTILTVGADGQLNNGVQLLSFNKSDDQLIFVTTENGEDNYKKAVMKHTYTFSKNNFSKVKEVKTEGTNSYFIRHQYILEKTN